MAKEITLEASIPDKDEELRDIRVRLLEIAATQQWESVITLAARAEELENWVYGKFRASPERA